METRRAHRPRLRGLFIAAAVLTPATVFGLAMVGSDPGQPTVQVAPVASSEDLGTMTVSVDADSVKRIVVKVNGHVVSDTTAPFSEVKASKSTPPKTTAPKTTEKKASPRATSTTRVPPRATAPRTTSKPSPEALPGAVDLGKVQRDYDQAHPTVAQGVVPAPANPRCGPPQVDPSKTGSCPY